MQKQAWTWNTSRLAAPARMARWGHFGIPVLIFPTAGGDFEEIERFQLIGALGELIDRGRMKAYSVDGLWVRAWLSSRTSTQTPSIGSDDEFLWYDSFLHEDVLQRIRLDCQDARIEPVLAGASLGACVAVGTLCRHPDSFRAAIGVSGVYRCPRDLCAHSTAAQYIPLAPLACLENLAGQQLERLRHRPIVLASGEGDYEIPADSQRLSEALSAKGVACRLDLWGPARDHAWSTWREMFPRLLAEYL
jgi:esterase/lipase superfamily enzyme